MGPPGNHQICSSKCRRKTKCSETRNFNDFRTILSSKIGQKSDAERRLFCDAMELTRAPPKVNGTHDFWTTNLATQMIRSSWSASRRPNHQRKFLRRSCCPTLAKSIASSFATKFCSKSSNCYRFCSQNPSKNGAWAPPNCSEIEANGTTKAELLSRSSQSRDFLEIWWFLDLQIGPPNHQNPFRKRSRKNNGCCQSLLEANGRKSIEKQPSLRKAVFKKNLVFAK